MNFKYFIIALYLLFVTLMVVMVFKSCGQNIGLESKDYYNEELKFQSTIDAKLKGNSWIDSFLVGEKNSNILVVKPKTLTYDSIKLVFKRPNNKDQDKIMVFNSNNELTIPKKEFEKGVYQLSIWTYQNNNNILVEKKVIIE